MAARSSERMPERGPVSRGFRLRRSLLFWGGLLAAALLTGLGGGIVLDLEARYQAHLGDEIEGMRALDRVRFHGESLYAALALAAHGEAPGDLAVPEGLLNAADRAGERLLDLTRRLGLEDGAAFGSARTALAEQERAVLALLREGRSEPAFLLLRSGACARERQRVFLALDGLEAALLRRHARTLSAQVRRADRFLLYGVLLVALLLLLWGGLLFGYRRWLCVLAENRAELAEAKAEAEEADLAKSLFLASVSHELRTPLNAVMGFAQMLQDQYYGPLNAKQAEYVDDIVQSAFRLNALITEVLDLSRVETGRAELALGPVRPAELAERVLSLVSDRALRAGVRLELDVAELPVVSMDMNKVRQALLCMLDTTVRHAAPGDRITLRALRADEARRERGAPLRGDWLLFVVDDAGGGMSEAECREMFRPFHVRPGEAENGWKGAGVGLALVRRYAELHGGTAWSESEGPGRGAAIIMALPMTGGAATPSGEKTR